MVPAIGVDAKLLPSAESGEIPGETGGEALTHVGTEVEHRRIADPVVDVESFLPAR
jgi:hypothetical protein